MLELNSVIAGYGEKNVLNSVSLSVGKSEIVGLVGPNGSGKSTVLKSIFGMVKVSQGEIIFKSEKIQNHKTSTNVLSGICYIPQGGKVFDKLTVQDNLEMGGVLIKDKLVLQERIEKMYERFDSLKKFRNSIAGKLSGGERQLVGLCRGLIMNPELILIDEPSIGLAPVLVDHTMELIKSIRDNYATTVLIVEQNVRAMLSIATRVYLLNSGKIVHDEKVETYTEERLRALFLK